MTLPPNAIPQYLERPRPGAQTFGTLQKLARENGERWAIVDCDPQLAIMAKRLFPGSRTFGQGVEFPVSRRTFGDLVWLMQRWPMAVQDGEAWEGAYADTVGHVLRRNAFNEGRVEAPSIGVDFLGELPPFQKEGVAWLSANGRTLLADEMGLGKTVQALAWLATESLWPALIVVQPHLVLQWQAAITRFLKAGEGNTLFSQGKLIVERLQGYYKGQRVPDAHIYLIHYGLLASWRQALSAKAPRLIVFDEIQELRHTGTAKYSAASLLAQETDKVAGLSGTPIYNRGGEIWAVLNIVEFHCLGDYESFTREWCLGYGSDTVSDPAALGAALRREGLMIRRRKEDVLKDLPPKRRIVETIDADEGLFAELIKPAIALAWKEQESEDALERGQLARQVDALTRRATGEAKVKAVVGFLGSLMEAKEPTIVFAHHHAVVDAILEGGEKLEWKPVCITGRETPAEKEAAKKRFVEGETDLVIVSLRSAAGLDGLQARARVVVFAELDWSPQVHAQAEDRAHRQGQRDSVLCYYLVTDQGSDPEMQERLGLKVSQFIGITGDKPTDETDKALGLEATTAHMKRLLAKVRSLGSRPGEAP